jgi:mono/diheme cytochrome c family protein
MFEQEIKMEEREASAIPLLLIATLILAIVGTAVHYLWQSKQVLTSQEATTVVDAALDAQGPVTILSDIIANGKNKMPAYGKSLKADDFKGLVAYIRTLKK